MRLLAHFPIVRRLIETVACGLAILAFAPPAQAAEIKVMISGGLTAAFKQLAPEFETATGHKITAMFGPSMGTTEFAIPMRLARGEVTDVVIMAGSALGDLVKAGKVVAASRVDLARARIAMVVRSGAPRPDISTIDALKAAMLAAKSIAYSDSASGVYIETVLLKKLGIEEQVRAKSRMIPAEPVAKGVARGESEIGFQQLSEILPVPGVDVVGMLPEGAQTITIFAAGVSVLAPQPEAGKALIDFLASPAAAPLIIKTGIEPIVPGKS